MKLEEELDDVGRTHDLNGQVIPLIRRQVSVVFGHRLRIVPRRPPGPKCCTSLMNSCL